MNVLVDYDNIDERDRRAGLPALAERITAAVGVTNLQSEPRLRLRLYGGWFDGDRRSRRAQDLIASRLREFPTTITLHHATGTMKVFVGVELAEALIAEPSTPLHRTHRPRSGTFGLRCKWPGGQGCVQEPCPLVSIPGFLQSNRCPTPNCVVTAENLLHKNEQKLTDTMLVCDLVYLAILDKGCAVAVVSSDDDMLPGIRTAINVGASVLQIHTSPSRQTPRDYTRDLAAGRFSQKAL